MPPSRSLVLLAAVVLLSACGSSPKLNARETERFLERSGLAADVTCAGGSDGWDYTCTSRGRRLGVDVDSDKPTALSNWVRTDEPLQVGPGGEGAAVRARFVDEANSVCREAASMIARLPRPVSRRDALSRLDQVLDLRRTEVAQLEAIKPPVALQPDYVTMVGAVGQLERDEMELRDGIATRVESTRRDALANRRRDAAQANEIAHRLGLTGCSDAAMPISGIVR